VADAEDIETRGLAAARRAGNAFAQSRLNRSLAGVLIGRNDLAKAEVHMHEGLRLDIEAGDTHGQLNIARGLAFVCEIQGRHADALEALRQVYPMGRDLENKREKAAFLGAYGRAHHLAGQSERALELCLQADRLFAELGHSAPDLTMSLVYETMADVHLKFGRCAEAIENYGTAVRLLRDVHDTFELAKLLVLLAKACLAAGDRDSASAHLSEALSTYETHEREEASEVRQLLGSLD